MEFDLSNREFYWFNEICKIPHPSRYEKGVSDFVKKFAEEHGLQYKQDDMYNIIVYKPASPGCEKAAPLILQGHMDMVPAVEKGYSHDFTKEPLDLYVDEEGWLHARHTTLGADDGIGPAQMLAILEDNTLKIPPLECLFTVGEELGLDGARNLKPEDIGADRLITLDCMDEACADLCSAGGCTSIGEYALQMEENTAPCYELKIADLVGGHSGADIHLERGNAIRITARILEEAMLNDCEVKLVSIAGGEADNAIPVRCETVFVSGTDKEKLYASFEKTKAEILDELRESEPHAVITLEETGIKDKAAVNTAGLVEYMYLIPNGFRHRSMEIEGLTYTSLNLGTVRMEGDTVIMEDLLRSMYISAMDDMNRHLALIAKKTGVVYKQGVTYSGWKFKEVSPLREHFKVACAVHGDELRMKAEHGGLEAGIFCGLRPGLDIVTVGADCTGYHTPKEKLNLASFHKCYQIVRTLVELCAEDIE